MKPTLIEVETHNAGTVLLSPLSVVAIWPEDCGYHTIKTTAGKYEVKTDEVSKLKSYFRIFKEKWPCSHLD